METPRLMGCTITTVASCECHHNAGVCIFSLHVKLHFTRHYIDLKNTSQAEVACVYYFGEDGYLCGYPRHPHQFHQDISEDDVGLCTPAHTFDGSTFRPFANRVGELECCEREHQAPNGDCLYPLAWLVLVSDQ